MEAHIYNTTITVYSIDGSISAISFSCISVTDGKYLSSKHVVIIRATADRNDCGLK